MAVSTQSSTPPLPHQSSSPSIKRRDSGSSRIRFNAELSQCLFDFVIQLLPTVDELAVKEDVRKLLERLIRTIEPDSRLLSFGSTANGFSLRNSDMDLCCLIDSEERLAASDLVTMLGDLLERETKFHVKPLPHARIPIVKLSLDPSPGLPLGIACDIGFENRLALENTRLLYCYAMIDPTRVRTMVLFLKVWAKRRKINSPYKGTLSSYGYVLLVIYFLVHVKNPPVLPNLQQMPPLRPISQADTHIGGNNVWFFDDIELLRQRWQSANHESVAQLLTDFFKFYARDFLYNTGVVSIRGGYITKGSKGWQNELESSRYKDSRERNRFCIEDPFETDFNVARCVTRDGLYTIRGEFMRASRILSLRPERAILAIAQLCEERSDVLGPIPTTPSSVPPRLSPFPPQTPYTVGSSPMRPNEIHMPAPSRASPPSASNEPTRVPSIAPPESDTPEHMAPQRHKWTSPPPANAPSADHLSFENRLGLGLSLATVPGTANIRQNDGDHSSNASEIYTDEGDVDEIRSMISDSVQSMASEDPGRARRSPPDSVPNFSPVSVQGGYAYPAHLRAPTEAGLPPSLRGRAFQRPSEPVVAADPHAITAARRIDRFRMDSPRRSMSGPPGPSKISLATPLPPSPAPAPPTGSPHVLYETQTPGARTEPLIPAPAAVYSHLQSHSRSSTSPSSSAMSSPLIRQLSNSPHSTSTTTSPHAHPFAPHQQHQQQQHHHHIQQQPQSQSQSHSPRAQMRHGQLPRLSPHAHSFTSGAYSPTKGPYSPVLGPYSPVTTSTYSPTSGSSYPATFLAWQQQQQQRELPPSIGRAPRPRPEVDVASPSPPATATQFIHHGHTGSAVFAPDALTPQAATGFLRPPDVSPQLSAVSADVSVGGDPDPLPPRWESPPPKEPREGRKGEKELGEVEEKEVEVEGRKLEVVEEERGPSGASSSRASPQPEASSSYTSAPREESSDHREQTVGQDGSAHIDAPVYEEEEQPSGLATIHESDQDSPASTTESGPSRTEEHTSVTLERRQEEAAGIAETEASVTEATTIPPVEPPIPMRATSYQRETTNESPTPSPSGSWQHLVSEPTIKDLSSVSAAPVPRISSTPRVDALEDTSISPESTSAGSGSPAPSLMSSMFGTSAPPSPTPASLHKLDAVPEWVEVVSANAHSGDEEEDAKVDVVVSERAEAVKTPVVSDVAQEVQVADAP